MAYVYYVNVNTNSQTFSKGILNTQENQPAYNMISYPSQNDASYNYVWSKDGCNTKVWLKSKI